MSEIKAGPAVDALVARMKGWKPWVSPCAPKGSTIPDCWLTGDEENPSVRMSGYHPSSDRGEALRLLEEHNSAHGPGLSLFCRAATRDYRCATTYQDRGTGFWTEEDQWHLTAALAIMVGILEANGVNVRAELAKEGG